MDDLIKRKLGLMQSSNASILDFVIFHSEMSPQTKAIVEKTSSTSYGELWAKALAVSAHIQGLDILMGSVVGVMLNDLDSALCSILGVMHAGCIYCPIDPNMNATKKLQVLDASSAAHVLVDTLSQLPGGTSKVPVTKYRDIDLGATPKKHIRFPVAYVMFTSGSTGQPKGVAISHRNLVSTYRQWEKIYKLTEVGSHLQIASLSFDVFAGDWLRALCSGATLYASHFSSTDTPEKLIDFIQSSRVECAEFTPMIMRQIFNSATQNGVVLDSFKLLIAGSDTMRAREFKAIRRIISPNCRLVFSYGTTETTIDTAYYEPTSHELESMPDEEVLPIGIPFPESELQILDEKGQSVDCGAIGELFIGGAGVGLGYIAHNTRTARRYLRALPDSQFGRWYRTGDLASFDGTYYRLHGRADARIKIRGKFVDLIEIEDVLREHRDVLDCAVTTVPDGDERSLAIAIEGSPSSTPAPSEFCEFLRKRINQPVLPDNILFMTKLPSTLSGKIDRLALNVMATEALSGCVK